MPHLQLQWKIIKGMWKKKCQARQETISLSVPPTIQWTGPTDPVVPLTFCELSKIISRKYTKQEMTFMVRISTCAQSMTFGTCTKFQLEIFIEVRFLQYRNFERIFWRARETLVKQPPGWRAADSSSGSPQQLVPLSLWSIHDSLQKNKMKCVVGIGKTQMWTLTDRPRADLCKLKFMCLHTSNGKLKLLKLEWYRLTTF